MTNNQHTSRIPDFSSRQEEAEFWDTHDITDFIDELTPVNAKFSKNLSEGITVRLDESTLNEIRMLASEQGIGPTTLMRMWVLDHLREVRNKRLAGS